MTLAFDRSAYVAEIEQNVLGALMIGQGGQETLSLLKEYHFIEVFHQHIYAAIKAAQERYNSSNPVIVKRLLTEQQIEAFEKANEIRMPDYIAHILGSATTASSASIENANKIIEQWARISLAHEAGRIHAAANDPMASTLR